MSQPVFHEECLPRINDLNAFAMYLCRDATESKDLVQETLLKAYVNISSYRKGSNARAWLFQICRNTFINSTRRKKFEMTTADQEDQGAGNRHPALESDLYAITEESFSDEVINALRAIPRDCQTALLLCDVEGYSYQEIADLTSTRPGTVRSRIFRGRKAMARMLSGYAAQHGIAVPAGTV